MFAFTWSPAWSLSDERSESDMPGSDREHREGFLRHCGRSGDESSEGCLRLHDDDSSTRNSERAERLVRHDSDTTSEIPNDTEADR